MQGNPIMCTCALKWTTETMGPTIIGICEGPSQLEGVDISSYMNYQGCQYREEVCLKLPGH